MATDCMNLKITLGDGGTCQRCRHWTRKQRLPGCEQSLWGTCFSAMAASKMTADAGTREDFGCRHFDDPPDWADNAALEWAEGTFTANGMPDYARQLAQMIRKHAVDWVGKMKPDSDE